MFKISSKVAVVLFAGLHFVGSASGGEFDDLYRREYERQRERSEARQEQRCEQARARVRQYNLGVAERFARKHGPVEIIANEGNTLEFRTRAGYLCQLGKAAEGHVYCLSRELPAMGEWDSKPVIRMIGCDTYERPSRGQGYPGALR